MNNNNRIISNYSRLIVISYFLSSLLMKEGRLILLKSSAVNFIITIFYYISLFFLLFHLTNSEGKLRLKGNTVYCIKKIFPLLILYLICELVAISFNSQYGLLYGMANITHFLSLFIKYIVLVLAIFLMYELRREKIMETLADALIINQIIIFVSNLFEYGFSRTIKDMFSLFTSLFITAESVFEVDGPTYCCGLVLLYYIFNRNNKIPRWKFLFLLFAFFVGRKRIAIIAFVMSVIIKAIFRDIELNKKKVFAFYSIVSGGMLLYLFSLYNGSFFEIMEQLDVGLSGRGFLYRFFLNRTSFSIGHLPWGLGGVEMVFSNVSYTEFANNFIAGALHNDILRIYVELGFVGFLLWSYIMTCYFPRVFLKHIGINSAKEYMVCVIFCLIIYTVSNSFFYSPLFSLLILVPLSTVELKE